MQPLWLCICSNRQFENTYETHTGEKSWLNCSFPAFISEVNTISFEYFQSPRILFAREKSNKCNQCDYACSDPSALRIHLSIHTGQKPYKCNQCDSASVDAGHLRTHMKIHSGIKSNKCNLFDHACSHLSSLRRHLKTHIGKKTNKCNQCDFASNRAGNLRSHILKKYTA